MNQLIACGDRASIVVAIACAVHCLAAPVLATSVQVAGAFASERTEMLFLVASLLISGATVVTSCLRRRARHAVWIAFTAGAGALLFGRVAGESVTGIEDLLVMCGAATIVAAHLLNLFNCGCRKEQRHVSQPNDCWPQLRSPVRRRFSSSRDRPQP